MTDLKTDISIPFEKHTLPNGLNLLLSQDKSSPFVAISLWYNVGAVHEHVKKTGLAHLFEHLMFEGTPHVKEDGHFKLLDAAGAFSMNASTSFERTNYYQTVPKNRLELALALEASRMFFLNISQEKLDEQREVVRREREQRFETSPYGVASLKLWQSIFGPNHPFYGRVIGSHEDLQAASLGDVKNFYNRFYGPTNATLTLVGDFEIDEAKKMVEKYFSTLPRSKLELAPKIKPAQIAKEEIIRHEEKIGRLPLIRMQYLTPSLFQPGDAEMDILADILAGGEHGRLNKALMRENQLAVSVSAYQQSMEQQSIFTIDVLLNDPKLEKDALAAIDKVLLGLKSNPPSKKEVERAQNLILTDFYFGLQEFGGHMGKAEALQSYNRYTKDPGFISKDVKRYQSVNSLTLTDTAQKYLLTKERKVLIATPAQNQMARNR